MCAFRHKGGMTLPMSKTLPALQMACPEVRRAALVNRGRFPHTRVVARNTWEIATGLELIGPLCADRMDTACVEVGPVDCIHRDIGDDPDTPKNQLLIGPDVCIDCAVYEPACPCEAI